MLGYLQIFLILSHYHKHNKYNVHDVPEHIIIIKNAAWVTLFESMRQIKYICEFNNDAKNFRSSLGSETIEKE